MQGSVLGRIEFGLQEGSFLLLQRKAPGRTGEAGAQCEEICEECQKCAARLVWFGDISSQSIDISHFSSCPEEKERVLLPGTLLKVVGKQLSPDGVMLVRCVDAD